MAWSYMVQSFLTEYGKTNIKSYIKSHTVSENQLLSRAGENRDPDLAGMDKAG